MGRLHMPAMKIFSCQLLALCAGMALWAPSTEAQGHDDGSFLMPINGSIDLSGGDAEPSLGWSLPMAGRLPAPGDNVTAARPVKAVAQHRRYDVSINMSDAQD